MGSSLSLKHINFLEFSPFEVLNIAKCAELSGALPPEPPPGLGPGPTGGLKVPPRLPAK